MGRDSLGRMRTRCSTIQFNPLVWDTGTWLCHHYALCTRAGLCRRGWVSREVTRQHSQGAAPGVVPHTPTWG